MRLTSLTTAVALLAVAWGVLSFGAVYPWAYWPLVIVAIAGGLAGVVAGGAGMSALKGLATVLGLIWIATAAQLVPIPTEILAKLSPATDRLLQQYDLSYAAAATWTVTTTVEDAVSTSHIGAIDSSRTHAISIRPGATWLGLAFLSAWVLFVLGLARGLTESGARTLAQGVVVVGLLVATTAVVQRAFSTDKIYGFWEPEFRGSVFGPFVNKNHFAGWMLMALSLGVGHFCGGVGRAMRGVKSGWRSRLLWFSSPQANKLVLTAFALVVMALSLVLSMSRSGITCLALALMLGGSFVSRRIAVGPRRAIAAGYLAFVFVIAVGWTGLDVIGRRFTSASWGAFGGRFGAWSDAIRVITDFPLTGTGLNTYGTAMLFYQTFEVDLNLFREAHNDYLQLAAEGGVLLGIPAALAVGFFIKTVRQRFGEASEQSTYWLRVGAVIGIVAIAVQEVVDFSLQMPGNAALFCVLVAIAIHSAPRTRPHEGSQRRVSHRARRLY